MRYINPRFTLHYIMCQSLSAEVCVILHEISLVSL